MARLKGTETEKNLLKAFAGESQARNRYTYFASAARKEGYVHYINLIHYLPHLPPLLHCPLHSCLPSKKRISMDFKITSCGFDLPDSGERYLSTWIFEE